MRRMIAAGRSKGREALLLIADVALVDLAADNRLNEEFAHKFD